MIARLLSAAMLLSACESVPAIDFNQHPDGSVAEAGDDGGAGEASTDAGADGAEAACPDTGPLTTKCCGHVPCFGDCSDPNCAKCEAQCSTTDPGKGLCCPKPGNVQCRPLGSNCP